MLDIEKTLPVIKKGTIVSISECEKIIDTKSKEYGVKDKYCIVQLLFLLLGLMHFLPLSFFTTANAYWMEKFRNVSHNSTDDATTRTYLQRHFTSAIYIADRFPFTIFIFLSAIFGYKMAAKKRLFFSLGAITVLFLLSTAFIKVNTDSWQVLFFFITIIIFGIISALNAIMETSSLSLLANFPSSYMSYYLFGEGCSGVFTSSLQIFSLAVGPSITVSAIIYFCTASFLLIFTVILFYFTSKCNKYYIYFVDNTIIQKRKSSMSILEIKQILRYIWPIVVGFIIYHLSLSPTHTAITSLVVSENYGIGNSWSDKYFVPVIIFLYGHICTIIGRIISSKIKWTIRGIKITIIMFIRMIIFLPLIFLCNEQPRRHLPVLLLHDWEYVIVLGVFTMTNVIFFTMGFLNMSKILPPEKLEDGYMILVLGLSIITTVSPIGFFVVDIL